MELKKFLKQTVYVESLMAGGLTLAVIWLIYYFRGFAPFGDNSLAMMDANIQYLDFFAYLKDVLSGDNSIVYTFSKVLGGTNIGVFSYYLSSPFNLLVAFFSKTDLVACFDLMVSLKLALAAITCVFFLNQRFKRNTSYTLFHRGIIVMLAVSYALCQYSIAQSSNIMWLDAVYILPLILLGVYRLVREEKIGLLSVSVAASVLFNWYTGGINCLFSIIWFCFEFAALQLERRTSLSKLDKWKPDMSWLLTLVRYCYAMLAGVLISGLLFLPTIGVMMNSEKGSMELGKLLDFSFIGNPFSAVENYVFGAKSSYGSVSLFCGSIVLLGCICCFIGKSKSRHNKILLGALLAVTVLLFYWNPFYALFSLLKNVGSYWYRYSYVGVISLVFLAASFYLTEETEVMAKRIPKAAGLFSALLLLLNYVSGTQDRQRTFITVIYLLVIAAAFCFVLYLKRMDNPGKALKRLSVSALCLLFVLETCNSVKQQMDIYHFNNAETVKNYSQSAIQQIDDIQNYDGGTYRIAKTFTRNWKPNNLTANYNEALAYNYRSISGYASSPDDVNLNFLDRLGYRINGAAMNIVNTSILAADSLLGVKYVISNYDINGLTVVDSIEENGNKTLVYENPYYLPMAFTYKQNEYISAETNNPFEYQNELYSELMGKRAELYIPLNYTAAENENGSLTYTITLPEGNYAIYGNLPWDSQFDATLDINGIYKTAYACWLSPSVFYIPTGDGDTICTVTINSDKTISLTKDSEQFYALNLDRLSEITSQIREQEVSQYAIENASASFTVEAEAEERLYISIPYDSCWTIKLNGEVVEYELFGGCMYSIQLEEGTNEIEMTYHVKLMTAGIICSVLGTSMVLAAIIFESRKKNFKHKKAAQ